MNSLPKPLHMNYYKNLRPGSDLGAMISLAMIGRHVVITTHGDSLQSLLCTFLQWVGDIPGFPFSPQSKRVSLFHTWVVVDGGYEV